MDEARDEVTQYLEGLIRNHLRAVRYEGPTLVLDLQTREFSTGTWLELWAAGLQSDNDVILSRLLQAANQVRRDAVGEEVDVLNGFLDQFTRILGGVGASEAAGFLQNVLEDLIRKDQLDEDELEDDDEDDFTGRGMTVTIGNRSMSVAFEDILSCFWSEDSQLNTTCRICGEPFINEPPIRTIAKGDKQQGASDVHVRVYNRHFSCIPSDRGFVPVSHVWDNSIRAANSDPNRGHNNAAASKLVATLEALFDDANENAYNVGVEFWHDYFSVPQWHSKLKDALLLRLPAIYYTADEILIHMADISSPYPWLLILGRGLIEGDDPLLQAMGKIPLLRAVCGSQWMQRMWVTLEYSQCRAACIMDKNNHIYRFADASTMLARRLGRDTFSSLIDSAHTQLIGLFPYAKTFADSLSRPGEFLGGMAARRREGEAEERHLCLGEAVELIARKECERSRDRLFGVHMLLNRNLIAWHAADNVHIPEGETEACRWVWQQSLARGDCSPLLLQPREAVVGSNPPPQSGFESWLVGYSGLSGVEWACGNQVSSPVRPPAADALPIRLDLDFVGDIVHIHYLDMENSGEIEGVNWAIGVLGEVARAEGEALTAQRLVDGLNRVFPFDIIHQRMARTMVNMVFSFEELHERDNTFLAQIQTFLQRYSDAPNDERGISERKRAAKGISYVLRLEENIAGNLSGEVTRLTRSRHIARSRRKRGADKGEPICEVRCPDCRRVTLFRLDLRDTACVDQSVYRIPGLSYSESVEDGVGLVMDNGRITGRMLYGPPACSCHRPMTVEVV